MNTVEENLKKYFISHCGENPFLIQFSIFELDPDDDDDENQYHKWRLLSCMVATPEPIYQYYEIVENDVMNLEVKSYKCWYETFKITEDNYSCKSHYRPYVHDYIYVSDLFPDFQPKNYSGIIWTRGNDDFYCDSRTGVDYIE